jgi:hypothetical protein
MESMMLWKVFHRQVSNNFHDSPPHLVRQDLLGVGCWLWFVVIWVLVSFLDGEQIGFVLQVFYQIFK